MDVPGDRSAQTGAPRVQPALRQALGSPRRRRPTGEPPPLPHHLQTSGLGWLVAAVVLVGLSVAVFVRGLQGPAVTVTVAGDAVVSWLGGLHAPGLVGGFRVLAAITSWWTIEVLGVALLLALLLFRRFRHLIVFLVAAQLVDYLTENLLGPVAQRPRPFGVAIRTGWGGWALPSLEVALLALVLVGVLYTLVPEGRWRNLGKLAAGVLVVLAALGRMALGADAPTDVLVGAAVGVAVPLLGFRLFIPNEIFPVSYRRGRAAHLDVSGARGVAIRRALEDQLGLLVADVKPFGLAGSAGSTPLRLGVQGDPANGSSKTYLFGKLYAQSHLRADRSYKLGRELLYGRLEDEKPFNAVRRLVQQEDYALALMQRAGLPSPTPYGFVELTPDREYLLVTEFFDGASELGDAEVTDQVIDDGLGIIRKLWDAGLAHRDVKPANLLVRDGRLLLIDVAFVEARPSPWRQAVDLANMMLCLALRSGPEHVYQRALRQFSVEEITEGFAAARGLALPSQLRRLMRAQGRDLHAECVRLLPSPPEPIRIQRWSARRVGLWAVALVLAAFVVGNVASSFNKNDLGTKTPLHIHNLACDHLEPLWLQAQAVPSASRVPCLRSKLAGWMVADVAVNAGRSSITLDQDRAGTGVVVAQLTADCDTSGAVGVPSDQPGVRRYERVEQLSGEYTATWFDRFRGGCVTYRLHSTADPEGGFANEARLLLGFTTRQALRQALDERSGGRLQLNPSGR
jgi:tRNA A-37 threonylcarbamoyl transferase component Bud32/membrane-associated phospholipid phosphatase